MYAHKMREDVLAHSTTTAQDKPEWLQKRLEWFKSLEFGIILHWGIYAFWDCCESWPLVPEDTWARNDRMKCWTDRDQDIDRFQQDYWNLIEQFNPTKFDADEWAQIFADAGAKYVCFTTKHHDGFCLWDTPTTDYKITGPRCPFKRDVTKELFDALHRKGLGVSVYFSKADWHCPYYWAPDPKPFHRGANTLDDPETFEKFVQYTHTQIRELLTNYGKIDILWLDAGWVKGKEDIRMAEIVEMGRQLQPGLLVANRTVGDFEDFVTPEREIPDEALPDAWEACLPLGPDWKYTEGQPKKSAEQIHEEITVTNQRGGNFLLGIGPTPSGQIPEDDQHILKELAHLRLTPSPF
jgi:alpha-L-fucosidase